MIHTQESQRKEEQRQRAQFDRAQMLQNEMDDAPTISTEELGPIYAVKWDNEGAICSSELEEIIKEFDGHLISNGYLMVGGLECLLGGLE